MRVTTPRIRRAETIDGRMTIIAVWCHVCEQECLPLRDGRCGFCETRVMPDGWDDE